MGLIDALDALDTIRWVIRHPIQALIQALLVASLLLALLAIVAPQLW
ncbi:MAG: hypothetical protein VW498_02395 [Candidatus Thalassarchaeaceae archaeon]